MFDVELTTSDLYIVSLRRGATIQSRNTNSCRFDLIALLACVFSYAKLPTLHVVISSNRLHALHTNYSEPKYYFQYNKTSYILKILLVFLRHTFLILSLFLVVLNFSTWSDLRLSQGIRLSGINYLQIDHITPSCSFYSLVMPMFLIFPRRHCDQSKPQPLIVTPGNTSHFPPNSFLKIAHDLCECKFFEENVILDKFQNHFIIPHCPSAR
jgi:hypothetical protein